MAEAVAKKSKLDNGATVSLRAPSVGWFSPSLGSFDLSPPPRSVASNQGQIGDMRHTMNEIEIGQHERRGPVLFLGGKLIGLYLVYMPITLVSQSA